jgi:hypothetical protein
MRLPRVAHAGNHALQPSAGLGTGIEPRKGKEIFT